MARHSCGCPESTTGDVLHTSECEREKDFKSLTVPTSSILRLEPSHIEPIGVDINPFMKGVFTSLAMAELRAMSQFLIGGYAMVWPPGTTDIGRALEVVLNRFGVSYTNALFIEIAQRVYCEIYP